ncbi:MAG TPA: alpha/beta hydrolase [Gammaproteobacteria bacterium]|nr:alpha/beta hydrolase [Gammaproteobacteria bacterium]
MKKISIYALLISSLFGSYSVQASAYGYPITDSYAATIIGTPAKYRAQLPGKIPLKVYTLPPIKGRKIPEVFWYQQGMKYSLAYQDHAAPLIFSIAGTGAGYHSGKMQIINKAFYQAGFHVVSLSSPTHTNFEVNASTSGIPGHLPEDSADLYQVMQRVSARISEKVEVTDYHLIGYSLGGAQAAFVAKLDEQKKVFNFKKVLMINPPLNLYHSVTILDDMLENNIPGGLDNFNTYYQAVMDRFSQEYQKVDEIKFNNEFLYRIYKEDTPGRKQLAPLIGLSFRISSTNMIFTADVMNDLGYVVPKGSQLTTTESLTDYGKVTTRLGFSKYFDEIFYPHFKKQDPSLTREKLIFAESLKSIEGYLKASAKIGMIHNADDLIMKPGEVDYLQQLLGDRAKVYPYGGHCGNMDYKDNVQYMVRFFTE